MLRAALLCLVLICGPLSASAEGLPGGLPGDLHVLKGRIIRSLAVEAGDARHILAGQKSSKPGSALVFQSTDGGMTWRTLNGNRPLAPEASDVQAVAAFSRDVLLAGTWKQGLYISRDDGASFARHADFPR